MTSVGARTDTSRIVRRFARRFAALLLALAVLALVPAGPAHASWLYAAVFVPDHAAPGATVRVTTIPFGPDRCPRLEVYLARAMGISSGSDRRLIHLKGRVEIVMGPGASSLGLTLEPNLVFRVPAIPAAIYHSYWRCPTEADPNAELWSGSDFRVEAAPPSTATGPVEPAVAADTECGLAALLAGAVGLLVALRHLGRRRGPATVTVGGDG